MRQLMHMIIALSLVGCEPQKGSELYHISDSIQHKRTLRYSIGRDGSTMIQAIFLSGGDRAVDVATDKDTVQSRGGFMRKIAFKDCSRVIFAATGKDRFLGIHSGHGMTQSCQIRDWESQWYIQINK